MLFSCQKCRCREARLFFKYIYVLGLPQPIIDVSLFQTRVLKYTLAKRDKFEAPATLVTRTTCTAWS